MHFKGETQDFKNLSPLGAFLNCTLGSPGERGVSKPRPSCFTNVEAEGLPWWFSGYSELPVQGVGELDPTCHN